jgi:hypothetical protein
MPDDTWFMRGNPLMVYLEDENQSHKPNTGIEIGQQVEQTKDIDAQQHENI